MQVELDFSAVGQAPDVAPEDIERLVEYLRQVKWDEKNQGWVKRAIIQADLGWDERMVRAVSRASRPRIVSYPGSRGYKLWERCTVPEHEKCLAAFRAQRNDMDESLLLYTRAFHAQHLPAR